MTLLKVQDWEYVTLLFDDGVRNITADEADDLADALTITNPHISAITIGIGDDTQEFTVQEAKDAAAQLRKAARYIRIRSNDVSDIKKKIQHELDKGYNSSEYLRGLQDALHYMGL